MSFNVKNGDLDVRWQLRHKQLKELEMDNLVFSRRKVLGQMAVSAAGILGLSATNKVFAQNAQVEVAPGQGRSLVNTNTRNRPVTGDGRATGQIITVWPNGNQTKGTGVLISNRHVLTAAHNLYWPPFGGHARVAIFSPSFWGVTQPYGYSYSVRSITHQGWADRPTHGGNYDIGLIRLAQPIGNQTGWMDLTPWNNDPTQRVNLNGYDSDYLGGLAQLTRTGTVQTIIDWPLSINSRYRGTWFAPAGVSGGPVWYIQSGRFKVIGVATSNSGMGSAIGIKNLPIFNDLFNAWMRANP